MLHTTRYQRNKSHLVPLLTLSMLSQVSLGQNTNIDYIPNGASSFFVAAETAPLVKSGDVIVISRPVTTAWIRKMKMDTMIRDGQPLVWLKPGEEARYERRVVSRSGNKVTIDIPFDFRAEGTARIEPHMCWATGLLLDNCKLPSGGINLKNRWTMGSGHGWTIGWSVAWNCTAKPFDIQQPPGSVNWVIGFQGGGADSNHDQHSPAVFSFGKSVQL